MKHGPVQRAISFKVPGEDARCTKEGNRWAVLDGRRLLRVTVPKKHASDISPPTLNSIRKQLKLDWGQFEAFVSCAMSSTEYETHLRELMRAGRI
jgi:hypothetical protein